MPTMPIICFFLEPTKTIRRWLRVYSESEASGHSASYHEARAFLDDFETESATDFTPAFPDDLIPRSDSRWPIKCEECDFVFPEGDRRQIYSDRLFKRQDTGEVLPLREAGPGAMYDAFWLAEIEAFRGPDGRSLIVIAPNGLEWAVDGFANNCDSPCANCGKPFHQCQGSCPEGFKDSHPHKCWVRHGEPPKITVDKDGITCGAGAGSIQVGGFHGFLRDGIFVEA